MYQSLWCFSIGKGFQFLSFRNNVPMDIHEYAFAYFCLHFSYVSIWEWNGYSLHFLGPHEENSSFSVLLTGKPRLLGVKLIITLESQWEIKLLWTWSPELIFLLGVSITEDTAVSTQAMLSLQNKYIQCEEGWERLSPETNLTSSPPSSPSPLSVASRSCSWACASLAFSFHKMNTGFSLGNTAALPSHVD